MVDKNSCAGFRKKRNRILSTEYVFNDINDIYETAFNLKLFRTFTI